jgi:hypothetical protein
MALTDSIVIAVPEGVIAVYGIDPKDATPTYLPDDDQVLEELATKLREFVDKEYV